jgi:hypothetical protein
LEKLLRLNPESGINAVSLFAEEIRHSKSLFVKMNLLDGLLAPLLKLLRSTNEEASYLACVTLSAFILKLENPSDVSTVVKESLMSKLDEKPASWMQRNSEIALLQVDSCSYLLAAYVLACFFLCYLFFLTLCELQFSQPCAYIHLKVCRECDHQPSRARSPNSSPVCRLGINVQRQEGTESSGEEQHAVSNVQVVASSQRL